HRHKETILRAEKAQEQTSKQDVAPVRRPSQQPTDAVAAAPSGHAVKAAPSKGQKQPPVASGGPSAASRRSVKSRGGESSKRADGMDNPKRPF
ncbi:hypothetical protein MTO96_039853, partial [Rhipicephalus appendiculatus]